MKWLLWIEQTLELVAVVELVESAELVQQQLELEPG